MKQRTPMVMPMPTPAAGRLVRLAAVAVVAGAVACAAGCGGAGPLFKGDRDVRPEPPGDAPEVRRTRGDGTGLRIADDAGGWPFVPASIRVHPFTSIVSRRGEGPGGEPAPVLEARVELLDQLHDPTKGVGRFRFELYARAPGAAAGRGERLRVWNAPLTTLAHNARHYDPITRTYSFRLHLGGPPPAGRRLTLHAQFTDHTGQRLTASAPVGRPAR